MDIFLLKLIAVTTMLVDHYGAIFKSNEIIYRVIGRLAFPIYAFLIVEGFIHTRDIKKYGIRLLLFAIISEIPFDYAFYGGINWTHQNIFFTLFTGILTLYFLDKKKKELNSNTILIVVGMGLLSSLLMFDYGIIGIVYISAFYLMREFDSKKKFIVIAITMFITNLLMASFLQQFSIFSLGLIYFYNGKLGFKNKLIQLLFYLSYPLHLIVYTIMR